MILSASYGSNDAGNPESCVSAPAGGGRETSDVVKSLLRIIIIFIATVCVSLGGARAREDGPDEAAALSERVFQMYEQGRYQEALPLAQKALALREQALGPDHPDLTPGLNNLAALYDVLGDFDRAEPLYLRALAITEKSSGPDHPDTAIGLGNLAVLYTFMGDFARAEPLYRRALAIDENKLGADDPITAVDLSNLAGLYYFRGEYGRAAALFERALAIRERAPAGNDSVLAESLVSLARARFGEGRAEKAVPLFERALARMEKASGVEHPSLVPVLLHLAEAERFRGRARRAEDLLGRALAVRERQFGKKHAETAEVIRRQAALNLDQGKKGQALTLYKRALAVQERALGPDHPRVAATLADIARVYDLRGVSSRARTYYQKALTAWTKRLGPHHPHVSAVLSALAGLEAKRGRYREAYRLYRQVQVIEDWWADRAMGPAASAAGENLAVRWRSNTALLISLAAGPLKEDLSVRREVLGDWLRIKGIGIEFQGAFQNAVLSEGGPESLRLARELASARRMLFNLSQKGDFGRDVNMLRKRLDGLERRQAGLARDLAAHNRAFAAYVDQGGVDAGRLGEKVPIKGVLIDYVQMPLYDFKMKKWGPPHYLAFVVPHGRMGALVLRDLGPAGPVDRAVGEWRRTLPDRSAAATLAGLSRRVHDLAFAPLQGLVGRTRDIILSPDGGLTLIPFEVLRGEDGRFLVQRHAFRYLPAGRDLVAAAGFENTAFGRDLIMGGPDLAQAITGPADEAASRAKAGGPSFSTFRNTLNEVRTVQTLLGEGRSDLRTGREANKNALKAARAPRILHLALPGAFLADLGVRPDQLEKSGQSPGDTLFLQYGLALSGADAALKSGHIRTAVGLLTPEEILGLNLHGTALAVLTDLDTGWGKADRGPALNALRRSFLQAGAGALVAGMWPVPEKEARELMAEFYRRLGIKGMDAANALREAMLNRMDTVRDRYGEPHPLFWGAFVYIGAEVSLPAAGSGVVRLERDGEKMAASDAEPAGQKKPGRSEESPETGGRLPGPFQRACFIGAAMNGGE